jgi:hypothetical protein
MISFYGEGLFGPRSTIKLAEHPISVVSNCLFNTFTATLYIWWRVYYPEDVSFFGDKGAI